MKAKHRSTLSLNIVYNNKDMKQAGEYSVASIIVDGEAYEAKDAMILREEVEKLSVDSTHTIEIVLA